MELKKYLIILFFFNFIAYSKAQIIEPSKKLNTYKSLIKHVEDRKGHDVRYAINTNKINNDLGWFPKTNFNEGVNNTIKWYLDNKSWIKNFK